MKKFLQRWLGIEPPSSFSPDVLEAYARKYTRKPIITMVFSENSITQDNLVGIAQAVSHAGGYLIPIPVSGKQAALTFVPQIKEV